MANILFDLMVILTLVFVIGLLIYKIYEFIKILITERWR